MDAAVGSISHATTIRTSKSVMPSSRLGELRAFMSSQKAFQNGLSITHTRVATLEKARFFEKVPVQRGPYAWNFREYA